MTANYLSLRFANDGDGTGQLSARAEASGFAGRSAAYFNIEDLENFARSMARHPLEGTIEVSSGFGKSGPDEVDQEHLAIRVYPLDRRGHIGVQIRMATPIWPDIRRQLEMAAKLELVTDYEPLRKFGADLISLLRGAT